MLRDFGDGGTVLLSTIKQNCLITPERCEDAMWETVPFVAVLYELDCVIPLIWKFIIKPSGSMINTSKEERRRTE